MNEKLRTSTSEYLRQASEDLVQWRLWGPEAFDEAQQKQTPMFISLGYSSCHWCHVMARESFRDPEIASIINRDFIPVKIDREQYPDVDDAYMLQASVYTENLGWPLNIFATPEGVAYYAGSYFPPHDFEGVRGLASTLHLASRAWHNNTETVREETTKLKEFIQREYAIPHMKHVKHMEAAPTDLSLKEHFEYLLQFEDPEFSGFGYGQKFPNQPTLDFLLLCSIQRETSNSDENRMRTQVRALLERNLDAILQGKIWDKGDGALFRYATTRDWREPHYERMLNENAHFLELLITAGNLCDEKYFQPARQLAQFLKTTMLQPDGSFSSSQNSETPDRNISAKEYYDQNVENRRQGLKPDVTQTTVAGWAASAIAALTQAGLYLNEVSYLYAAEKAADYLVTYHLRFVEDQRVCRIYRQSRAGHPSPALATRADALTMANCFIRLGCAVSRPDLIVIAAEIVQYLTSMKKDLTLRNLGIDIGRELPNGVEHSDLTIAQETLFLVSSLGNQELSDLMEAYVHDLKQHEFQRLYSGQAEPSAPQILAESTDQFRRLLQRTESGQQLVIRRDETVENVVDPNTRHSVERSTKRGDESPQYGPARNDHPARNLFIDMDKNSILQLERHGFEFFQFKEPGHYYRCVNKHCALPISLESALKTGKLRRIDTISSQNRR